MNFLGIIKISLVSLKNNKTRSLLTVLGIVIGIAAVIIIMAVGSGAQSLILSQIENVGSNLIGVMPGAADEKGPPAAAMGIQVTTLTAEDAEAVLKQIPEATAAAAFVSGADTITWQNQKIDATFLGVSSSYTEVENAVIENGRFFDESEENSSARAAVLGWQAAQDLFGGNYAIGQSIKIKRESFEVIGVFKKRGKVAFQDVDNQVFVPLPTGQKILLGIRHVNLIRIKINDSKNAKETIESVKAILRDRHNVAAGEEDFDVRDQADAIAALTNITNALKFFLAAVAGISLLVGGIGIMNIMYVAVTERTAEIGLRKAVGAGSNAVLSQFLIEAIIVTMLGGILGIIIGMGFAGLVAVVAGFLGYQWHFGWPVLPILMSVIIACGIGLIFGYFPAKRAAKLSPIEALRYE